MFIENKRDSVWVIHIGGNLSGLKGKILESWLLVQHNDSGKWIIAKSQDEKNYKLLSPCSGGPFWIDFKRKKVWMC